MGEERERDEIGKDGKRQLVSALKFRWKALETHRKLAEDQVRKDHKNRKICGGSLNHLVPLTQTIFDLCS